MPRNPKCKLGQHTDVLLRGGKSVRCTTCGDTWPCRHECDHFDCRCARGEEMPPYVDFNPDDAEAVIAEALGTYRKED
jgi:hypothetical protein